MRLTPVDGKQVFALIMKLHSVIILFMLKVIVCIYLGLIKLWNLNA